MTSNGQPQIACPTTSQSITLSFQGDWGRYNMHRICGWLSSELIELFGPQTRIAIWNGTGAMRNLEAVGHGQVDLALITPASFGKMAVEGAGPCAGEALQLRALGQIPHNDRLIFAIRSEFAIRSFEDLRREKPPLRIVTGLHNGENFMGFAALQLLEASGTSKAEMQTWGCTFVELEHPAACVQLMESGGADAIIQEAVGTPHWRRLAETIDLTFVPVEEFAAARLLERFGWPNSTLPNGYLQGMPGPHACMDFSDFLLLATPDLPERIAYAIAWCLIERWDGLEQQYRHLPADRSPVSYPIDPRQACRTPIPLHAGADRYFRQAGHLQD